MTFIHRAKQPERYQVAPKLDRIYGGITFRSKAESKYAAQLDVLKKAQMVSERVTGWDYEYRRFPLVCGSTEITVAHYTPDFRVRYLDGRIEWHEVKGQSLPMGNLKIIMFRACYPDECLRIIDSKTLAERGTKRRMSRVGSPGAFRGKRKPRPEDAPKRGPDSPSEF